MNIQVSCFATLSSYAPEGGTINVSQGTTAGDIVEILSIPREEVKIIFVNGQNSGRDAVLKENDRVGIFPAIGGG